MDMAKRRKIRLAAEDRIFYAATIFVILLVTLLIAYPLIFIVSSSFSSTVAVASGQVFLWPVDFSIDGYTAIFETDTVMTGYRNSIFYTLVGTCINIFITILAAYPLSRRDLPGKNWLMFLFSFTMIFSGGMITNYLLIGNLNMLNTIWAMLVPGALNVYNMIIMRTFFQNTLAQELLDAAQIDGCSDFRFLMVIALPLSKAVLAVVTMYYALGHWNAYFNAFLYLTDDKLYPLQIVLRNILLANQIDPQMLVDEDTMSAKQGLADLMKYSLIVVATVPVLAVYPFVQKYFVKGVMIGSIKG